MYFLAKCYGDMVIEFNKENIAMSVCSVFQCRSLQDGVFVSQAEGMAYLEEARIQKLSPIKNCLDGYIYLQCEGDCCDGWYRDKIRRIDDFASCASCFCVRPFHNVVCLPFACAVAVCIACERYEYSQSHFTNQPPMQQSMDAPLLNKTKP